jgi:hypothetical protein
MNKPTALPQLDSTKNPGESYLNDPKTDQMKPGSDPLSETPHRAAAVTPRIADLLARIEGIQRWGLNE